MALFDCHFCRNSVINFLRMALVEGQGILYLHLAKVVLLCNLMGCELPCLSSDDKCLYPDASAAHNCYGLSHHPAPVGDVRKPRVIKALVQSPYFLCHGP